MSTTYTISKISDLLKVPADLRSECLREIQYALALCDLAIDGGKHPNSLEAITWTDDNLKKVNLEVNGERLLTLEIKKNGDEAE